MTSSPTWPRARAPSRATRWPTDKLLYATHSGAVPGPWNATNKGPDPYLATRTANGWTTDYEGLPANLNPAAGSFSSVLGEADSSLEHPRLRRPGPLQPLLRLGPRNRDPRPHAERRAGPGHGGLAGRQRSRLGQTRRQGRQVLLRRRQGPPLRLQIRLRARRQRRAATSPSMSATSAPGRPRSSPPTRAATPSPARSPSSTSPATAPASSPARRSRPTPQATNTSIPTSTSPARPGRSTSPRARPPASSSPG